MEEKEMKPRGYRVILRMCCCACVVTLGFVIAPSHSRDANIDPISMLMAREGKGEPPPPKVAIRASLNQTDARPGDLIRLTEVISVDLNIKIRSYRHAVYVVGQYDMTQQALINREPDKPRYWNGELVFDDWSGNSTGFGDGWFSYTVSNPREEGLEIEFKARQLGIYLIRPEWHLYKSDTIIESNPIILTVGPPLDNAGRPIIKESWIDPLAWKYRPKD
jgi:hypothetical protein